MSLFYGIFCKNYLAECCQSILKDKATSSGKKISSKIFCYEGVAAIKYDVNAYSDEGYFENKDKGFCLVSGNPLLTMDGKLPDRSQQVEKIFDAITSGDCSILSNCRGQFSMAIYNRQKHSMCLIADSNGSRPLFYCFKDNILSFGGNLKTVVDLAGVQDETDWKAEVQKFTFGSPLGDRTVNKKVKVLRNGEILLIENNAPKCQQYFRWDALPEIDMDSKKYGQILYNEFSDSISLRARLCKNVMSTLSGGLDSRCVVAGLKEIGKAIMAFNISNPGEKDVIYARAYANAIKLNLFEIKRPEKYWTWGELIADAIKSANNNNEEASSGHLVFSGDGGSVGLGRVYLEAKDLDCLSRNGINALARQFITDKRRMPPISYFIPQKGNEILESLIEGMMDELNNINCSDPGKKLFLFFMQNDQRRHLHQHYENILTHKIELLVPFMDKKFYELIVSGPAEMFLYHAFYHDWLNFFPDTTHSVPWQTYPGHKECPIKNGNLDGIDQWAASRNAKWNKKCLCESAELIRLGLGSWRNLQANEVNKLRLFAACLAHACGIGSYDYLIKYMRMLSKS